MSAQISRLQQLADGMGDVRRGRAIFSP